MKPTFCPMGCSSPITAVGSVFVESGEYDDEKGQFEAEGQADVYECAQGHSFAFNPPFVAEGKD